MHCDVENTPQFDIQNIVFLKELYIAGIQTTPLSWRIKPHKKKFLAAKECMPDRITERNNHGAMKILWRREHARPRHCPMTHCYNLSRSPCNLKIIWCLLKGHRAKTFSMLPKFLLLTPRRYLSENADINFLKNKQKISTLAG